VISWADVIAAVRVLISDERWDAKYLAIRVLYKECKVENISVEYLLVSLIGVLSVCSITTREIPVKQNIANDPNFDAVTTFVTVMLTFIFGKKPGQGRINHMLDGLGHIPRRSLGLNHLIEVAKRIFKYCTGISSPENCIEQQILEMGKKVNYWITSDGDKFVMQDPRGFDEVTKAIIDANELQKSLHSSHLKQAFAPTLYELRKIHSRVLRAPVSGHSYRKEPVVVHIVGEPGVGKTAMISALAADALKKIFELQGMPDEDQKNNLSNHFQYIYYRPQGHKYETNYNTSFSKIYVVDDANQIDPDMLVDDLPWPARIIHMNNNADLLLPVAEIENKQTAKFNSDLIIATDNQATPDLSYLQNADAYFRRIDLEVFASIDPHYTMMVNGVPVLDPSKLSVEEFDVSAYQFQLSVYGEKSGPLFNFNSFINQIKSLLEQKHISFTRNRANLSAYATRHWKETPVKEADDEKTTIPCSSSTTTIEYPILPSAPLV
jgi:hypothetical protein